MIRWSQTDWSEITWGKCNEIFRSNRANQEEWLIPFFITFPNPLHKWRELGQWTLAVCQSGTGNFGRMEPKPDFSIWLPTEISGLFETMESSQKVGIGSRSGRTKPTRSSAAAAHWAEQVFCFRLPLFDYHYSYHYSLLITTLITSENFFIILPVFFFHGNKKMFRKTNT